MSEPKHHSAVHYSWLLILPVWALALTILTGSEDRLTEPALELLLNYGAVLLAFCGAAHWGLAAANYGGTAALGMRYTLGIIPMLLAFGALLLPDFQGMSFLCGGFLAALAIDYHLTARGFAPLWYRRMQSFLTWGVIIALGLVTWYLQRDQSGPLFGDLIGLKQIIGGANDNTGP
ncbi:MAG: DUF3429 domain-containing protein [Dongiaceae bacterium]